MDIEALERREIRKKQLLVGLLFSGALGLSLLFAYWMGAWGLGATRTLYVRYNFAGGIDRGSPVRLAGIKIGRVTSIDFDHADHSVLKLSLEINRDALRQVTNDSQFYINLAGLIGERYVEIVPGQGTPVEPQHSFQGIDPPRIDQLISQGYGIFGDLRSFFNENRSDLKEMFLTLNDLSKNLNKLMSSASPSQRKQVSVLLENFAAMSSDLRATVSTLRNGVSYIEKNGAAQSWDHVRNLVQRADSVSMQDLRKLMLEDGVKINFSSKKVESDKKEK